eukprot:scaffold126082_cov57-Phaeocystis_antarctica.AAC.1
MLADEERCERASAAAAAETASVTSAAAGGWGDAARVTPRCFGGEPPLVLAAAGSALVRLPPKALLPFTAALSRSKEELRPLSRFTGTLALLAASAVAAAAAANSWNLEEPRAVSTPVGGCVAPGHAGAGVLTGEAAPARVHGCAAAVAALMRRCGARQSSPSSSGCACCEREDHTGEVKAGGTVPT